MLLTYLPNKQLLSTHLLQRGGDSSGILGFLIRDIRQEVNAAKQRKCAFCDEMGASVFCAKCRIVFHMGCGFENRCVTHFCDQFLSYCENCAPLDSYKRQLLANPPKNATCDICMQTITIFNLANITYGDCCRKGFAHRTCMRRHALASGYYLRCPWCRDKKFHDTIKLQSVYVPDRDAIWEQQPNAYRELHEKLLRCDQAECICPKGRNYNKNSWSIQVCVLCAATGTHFKCSAGILRLPNANTEQPEFKCSFCKEVESKLQSVKSKQTIPSTNSNKSSWETADERIDVSFYTVKRGCDPVDDDSPDQTDDDERSGSSTEFSIITVLPSKKLAPIQPSESVVAATQLSQSPVSTSVIELPDSQPLLSGALEPPLLLHQSFTSDNYFYLIVYEYDERQVEACTGTCTLRFALDDPRLNDCSEEALQQLQVVDSDVWLRDTNRGIYDKIDQYTK